MFRNDYKKPVTFKQAFVIVILLHIAGYGAISGYSSYKSGKLKDKKERETARMKLLEKDTSLLFPAPTTDKVVTESPYAQKSMSESTQATKPSFVKTLTNAAIDHVVSNLSSTPPTKTATADNVSDVATKEFAEKALVAFANKLANNPNVTSSQPIVKQAIPSTTKPTVVKKAIPVTTKTVTVSSPSKNVFDAMNAVLDKIKQNEFDLQKGPKTIQSNSVARTKKSITTSANFDTEVADLKREFIKARKQMESEFNSAMQSFPVNTEIIREEIYQTIIDSRIVL
jgi:hypothetical protein